MTGSDRAAVIVAGGYSRRFGDTEKAIATVDGTPLIRRVVERAQTHVDEVIVNCRRDQHSTFENVLKGASLDVDIEFAHDRFPDGGPVWGMAVGLQATSAEYALVLSCDLPFLDCEIITEIFERAETDQKSVVPITTGRPQPLFAVYHREEALDACGDVLAAGDTSARSVVGRLETIEVPIDHTRPFRDVDTQRALEEARRST